jgi:glycosyltransferase involved in cell wall biosynthesis
MSLNRRAVTVEGRLRVLMVTPKYPPPVVGGLENQAHELAKALVREGLSLHALSTRFDPSHQSTAVIDGVHVLRIQWSDGRLLRFLLTPLPLFRAMWRLRKQIDVVHLHQSSPFCLSAICMAKLLGKPVLTKLASTGDGGLPGMRRSRFGRFRLLLLLWSDAIVAMTSMSLDELRESGYLSRRVLQTPNGIRLRTDDRATLACSNPNDSICKVVFVGRLSQEKRLNVLLESWAQAQPRFRQTAQLEIWGAGPDEAHIRAEIRRMRLADTVVMRGHVPDVRSNLRNCDVFVLPSAYEGNSNAVLEAMEAGLPVIATKVGGTPMQIGPEGADLLVPVDDADSLADQLVRLINDSALRRAYGDAMRRRARDNFDIARIAKRYICAYQKLATDGQIDLRECGRLPEGYESSSQCTIF